MPKLKTKSGVKRRFRVTGTGKILSTQSGKRHGMRKRSRSMKRKARGTTTMKEVDAKIVLKYAPYPQYLS
ncbi:MAG: 50S ribosomal protein L35 [Dongiaceae bacterium]